MTYRLLLILLLSATVLLLSPAASFAKPDIYIIEFKLSPATPTQGKPVQVTIGVYNKGTSRAGAYRVEWWAGERFRKPACSWKVSSNNPRGGRTLKCTYSGYGGWYNSLRTKVVADTGNTVSESNETNNVLIKTIKVKKSSTGSGSSMSSSSTQLNTTYYRGNDKFSTIYRNGSLLGGQEIDRGRLTSRNPLKCSNACLNHSRCTGWQFNRSQRICVLKRGPRSSLRPNNNNCCEAGIILRNNERYALADTVIKGRIHKRVRLNTNGRPRNCKQRCDESDRCIAWVYVKPGYERGDLPYCILKSEDTGRKKSACCISGSEAKAEENSSYETRLPPEDGIDDSGWLDSEYFPWNWW